MKVPNLDRDYSHIDINGVCVLCIVRWFNRSDGCLGSSIDMVVHICLGNGNEAWVATITTLGPINGSYDGDGELRCTGGTRDVSDVDCVDTF